MSSEEITLLLIDDDDIDAESVTRGFKKSRIANQILRARDGVEGLEMLRSGAIPQPFIILLDINMPRMNGHEFLAELRADPSLRSILVFVLTTSNADRDRMQAYDKQVAGYILKDQAGDDFIDLIRLIDSFWHVVKLPGASH